MRSGVQYVNSTYISSLSQTSSTKAAVVVYSIDSMGYHNVMMEELDLLDIYRQLHADTKSFTYETKNSKLKSRIDFFLVSRPISYNVKRTEVRSSIAPDHKAIFLGMELQSKLKRGPGTCKFNNTLLEDQDYIDLINFIYPRTLEKYKDVESKQLLWEVIKMELRAKTMSYSKRKRAELKMREIVLQHNLDELDYKICNDADLNPHILDQDEAEKNELNSLYESKGKKAIFRSKLNWIEQGEKPTKYFFNLEKKNYVTKTLLQMNLDNGKITSDMKKINKQIEVFFSETYKSKLTDVPLSEQELGLKDFIQNFEIPRLSNEEKATFEHELTVQEIKKVLHSFEKNKTPGEEFFSKEFYETFFGLLKQNLLDSYNETFQKGSLSVSQRRGIISLILKNDCDLSQLTGWRPITLLNVDYKILAKCIAKRIEPFLPKLIHSDQTGFMKDRFIGQNVRLLNDLMEYTDVKKISGIFLFIDFEKAFDSIEWNFIKRSLELFNLGPFLTRWFSILCNNSEAAVMSAGYMTDYVTVSRGVRQGCPLSPFLLLSVDLLALKIRQEPNCKVIRLPNLQEAKSHNLPMTLL